MILKDLIRDIDPINIQGELDINIEDIFYDSRQVKDNCLFIAIEGFKTDGHNYIDKAINNGARAVIIEKEIDNYREGVTYLKVDDSRKAMSYLARTFFNYPLNHIDLIGVTGTNGKTTSTYLIKAILDQAGYKTGIIGTIKNIIGEKTLPATRTTPESLDLYKLFSQMVAEEIDYVVMEVSSHALDLKRVQGMEFQVAVFTNLTQDHLDYHISLHRYLEAKSQLFKQLKKDGFGIINFDDPNSDAIMAATNGQVVTYALTKKADIVAEDVELTPQGVSFIYKGGKSSDLRINLNFTGMFNVYNALGAIGAARVLGIEDQTIKKGLENINGVPGRFELIKESKEFAIVVDYAHSPDGMENVLETALDIARGKIILVFGAGGDRDKGKRPLMGKIGAKYGDYCVLTSDNPRSEEPLTIIRDIEAGIKEMDSHAPYTVIADRKEAIYHAVKIAEKDDMVIVFGKGHETYQIFQDKTIHFDDREVAREALNLRLKGDLQ